ncbi:hypothetical protein TIFTF001_003470 [Ficus carica]|uniref:Uncharacterized protein n=1 Tax=Ficus carica TaxID=3494 RepID=A0AA88DAJ4_FICCA|nr:hypothetical protein TIFTF001_003470 [Ficus carica]
MTLEKPNYPSGWKCDFENNYFVSVLDRGCHISHMMMYPRFDFCFPLLHLICIGHQGLGILAGWLAVAKFEQS